MSSLSRKIARNKNKKNRKKAEKKLSEEVGLFNKIPDQCLVCEKDFDKKDKEQVTSWYVVVKAQEKKVNLYCPECWETAQKVIGDFMNDKENK